MTASGDATAVNTALADDLGALLRQHEQLLEAFGLIVMDTQADQDRHHRVQAAFHAAVAPIAQRWAPQSPLAGAAPAPAPTPADRCPGRLRRGGWG